MLESASFRAMWLLYVVDIAATLVALGTALLARRALGFGQVFEEQYGGVTVPVVAIVLVAWTSAFLVAGAYDARRLVRLEHEVARVIFAVGLAVLFLAGSLYFSYRAVSRLLMIYFIILDVVLVLAARIGARFALRRSRVPHLPPSRVLVVGAGVLGRKVARSLAEYSWTGLQLVGYLDDDPAKFDQRFENVPVLGTLEDAAGIVVEKRVTDVILTLPLRAHREIANVVIGLELLPVNIKMAPDLESLAFYRLTMETLDSVPLFGLKEPVIGPAQRVVKRAMDLGLTAVCLPPVLVLTPVIAAAIRLDSPGPIFFSQQRIGEGGEPFTMYKFRTMQHVDDERTRPCEPPVSAGRCLDLKTPNDPRITRVGRLLRRWSIDELPQLWNVLRGDMSLVGPRPEQPDRVERYEGWQRKRFGVPQGLTGWWQINGRSDRPSHLHVDDDLYYIQHYSLLMDIRILMSTVGAVLRGRGAY